MKYERLANDPERFATNLRRDSRTGNLIWDSARGQDALIVQTPFGKSAVSMLDEICTALENRDREVLAGKFMEITDGIWICYVTAADKARNQGCALNDEASTYTVFSCSQEQELLKIYEPQEQAMISPHVDIPLEIRVKITKEPARKGVKGFFRKNDVETGYYRITFPQKLESRYADGSMSYCVEGFEIPVTKEMISQGTVYIKSAVQPELQAKNGGLRIEFSDKA